MNHLFESTLFAAGIWLLARLLDRNPARYRHSLWVAASMKFLIPFTWLVWIGGRFAWPSHFGPSIPWISRFPIGVTPALPTPHGAAAASGARAPNGWIPIGVWLAVAIGIGISRLVRWRRLAAAVKRATPHDMRGGVPVRLTDDRLEPGVLGILRPVLVLPRRLAETLTPGQLDAIVAHELCHVKRYDNLTALIQMVVETIFWFHPLVWWIGTRLVEERERACDEAVVQALDDPETYAQGILNVCRTCLQSPVAFVSGVTGGNLTRRIERIMRQPALERLGRARKALLAGLSLAIVAGPILVGMSGNASAQAPAERLKFEAASIKVAENNNPRMWGDLKFLPGGRFVAKEMPLRILIAEAYKLPFQSERLSLARGVKPPEELYNIEAVGPKSAFPEGISSQERNARIRLMLQSLLADRFHLKIRVDPKEQPVYSIVVGKGGPKLELSKMTEQDCDNAIEDSLSSGSVTVCHSLGGGQGRGLHGAAVTIADVALFVQNWTDKPVIDETGLTALYNIQTEGWTPMRIRPPNPDGSQPSGGDAGLLDPERQTLYKVLEQLGLRMESKRAVVDMYVVEGVERPTEN